MRTGTKLTLLFTLMYSLHSIAAAPSLSSAVLSGSTITINGTNFSTKSPAAPVFFQPFTALSNGANPTNAGFDTWINRGGEAVTNADGVGGGSLRVDMNPSNNAFTHIGKWFDPADEVYVALFFKLYGSSQGSPQLKFTRAGSHVSGGNGLDDYNSYDIKFYCSLWGYGNLTLGINGTHCSWRSNVGEVGNLREDEGGYGWSAIPEWEQTEFEDNTWVFGESYFKLNDTGQNNGVIQIRINNETRISGNQIALRTEPNQRLSFVQPIPSIDLAVENGATISDYDWAISRILIDTTRAHVFLSNSVTASGITQQFVLPATVWSDSSITVNHAVNIPSGYNYVYVVNKNGEINSTGIAYTTFGCNAQ